MRKGHHRERGERRQYQADTRERPEAAAKVDLPPRVPLPRLPTSYQHPETGEFVWTCRAGFERQLFEELAWNRLRPTLLGPALIASQPPKVEGYVPTFARMGFPMSSVATSPKDAFASLPTQPTKIQVWSPDTDAGNALSHEGAVWDDTLAALRAAAKLPPDPATPWKAWEAGAWLGQVCLLSRTLALVGQVRAREAASLSAGGRTRMKRTAEAPSRAAMKLDEALDWYGVSPGKGDVCVDLGSAPGGWTRRLVERGARVWSIDPGKLAPDLATHPKVKHHFASAFEFAPPSPADWLFCDMAWRPLEVAQLLGKWARRGWATQLVSNIKLPMKDKLPMLLRVRKTLEDAGWKRLKMRQLYHDRDEVTVTARRET